MKGLQQFQLNIADMADGNVYTELTSNTPEEDLQDTPAYRVIMKVRMLLEKLAELQNAQQEPIEGEVVEDPRNIH